MGYTHYLLQPKKLGTAKQFDAFTKDVRKILDYCQNDLGIKLGDWAGENEPEITKDTVCFNGSTMQPKGIWTTPKGISIPWPSPTAGLTEPSSDPIDEKTDGNWFAGDLVSSRVAPLHNDKPNFASGDYETFEVTNNLKPQDYQEPDEKGRYFTFCKTAYRPYDLAVTAIFNCHKTPLSKMPCENRR